MVELKNFAKNKRDKRFFLHDAEYVAKNLLGDYLVFKNEKSVLAGKIVETEAYLGRDDDASHSYQGKVTQRNKIMYEEGGLIYVYLIYGKFYCFNIIVSRENDPQAVFIRALEPKEGIEIMKENRGISDVRKLTNGPCRWTAALGIDKSVLGRDIVSGGIFISESSCKDFSVVQTKRVGIDYAVKGKDMPLRFYIKDNFYVSKK